MLISALTSSFFTGIQNNPDVPADLASQAETELASGVPFVSNDQLESGLKEAGVEGSTAQAVIDDNEQARIDGLRAALAVLALAALLALFTARSLPTRQPGAEPAAAAQPEPTAPTAPTG